MKFKQIYFKQLYQKQSWYSDSSKQFQVSLSVGSIPISGKEKCYLLPIKSNLLNTVLKFSYPNKSCCSASLEPSSSYFMPMSLLSSPQACVSHSTTSIIPWMQISSGPLVLSLHSKSKPQCRTNASTSLLPYLDYTQ